jgi:hypothetical protein
VNKTSQLRIVVTGLLAQYPLGGVTWDYLQYVVGLAQLGHDVYYVEDTGQWPYNPAEDGLSTGCEANVAHLARILDRFGLDGRWAFRFAWQDQWFGLDSRTRTEIVRTADLVVNVSGVMRDPAGLDRTGILVYVDSDPVFTQVKIARGQRDFRAVVDSHDVHFSFGETLGDAVPSTGHRWLPTRQPVVLAEWAHTLPDRGRYSTVMNWSSYNDVEFNGKRYGQKDVEFRRFLDLPAWTSVPVEVAMASGRTTRPPYALLRHRGWSVVDPALVCPDLDSYRHYLQTSRGEWSVAKNGYVRGRPGWFSCRSACYLAAGRPVITQDTGFGAVLPLGMGLFAFTSVDEAAAALDRIESDYARHADAAREIAAEYFDSARVLTSFIERALDRQPASRPAEAGRYAVGGE